MSRRTESRRAPRLPMLAVPWLAYLAVTIVAPALNGAWRRPDFASHAWLTIIASGALLAVASLVRRLLMDRRAPRG